MIIGGLWWLVAVSDRNRAANLKEINSHPAYSKGVITQIFYYKGHSLRVKYTIDNVTYEHIGGWDKNLNHLGKGDSVRFRYSINKPELIITEMESEY
ncbi:hypothetical protein [Mucilaginibacter gossypiicola]|uniref:hypothetical protein n=1 Tax=Mucilaginibacter gossypiicola TaxID=551995 RepID=UPI00115FDBBB|nr:hypothetical protein [Mucilaginibacter gossypiicola]